MRILVAEDDRKAAAYLQKGLSESGFVVDVAESGQDALHLALTGPHDLLILDIMLPGPDGWTILSELRSRGRQTPVLFLTARDAVLDRVKGLELGADDYLVNPFSFSELLARVRSVLRRGTIRPAEMLQVADLEVDLLRRHANRAGKRLELTPKEFGLLALFMQRPGEVLSRALIADYVWGINFSTDTNVIDVAVRRLRRKVDEPFGKDLIHTVRGVGYVLEDQ
jgi:two-component system copper resistance phosphate regulon response regulator CusR